MALDKLFMSFRDGIKDKITNPFLGTYIFVWFIRNWELVYSLFNFDKAHNLAFKLDFIKAYYNPETNPFIPGVFWNIIVTFGVLIATYVLLNLSRLIVNFSEMQIKPLIFKITDSKSIVLKEVYDTLRNNRDDLQARLENERDFRSRLESKIKDLEETNRLTTLDQNKETDESNSSIESQSTITEANRDLVKITNQILESNQKDNVKETIIDLKKGYSLRADTESVSILVKYDLIRFREVDQEYGGSMYYELTERGKEVDRLLNQVS